MNKHSVQMTPAQLRSPDTYVKALVRGLSVIHSFGPHSRSQTLTRVAESTGMERSRALRFLSTLETLGYVRQEGSVFNLTPRVLELGYSHMSALPLSRIAEPIVRELVQEVNESSSVSVLDGSEIVYIVRVPVKKIMNFTLSVGSRIPGYCTAMGRVLLGDQSPATVMQVLKDSEIVRHTRFTMTSRAEILKTIEADHEKGWSMCNQELEEGICSIAVPLVGREGKAVAAMNIAGNVCRTTPAEMVSEFLPWLKKSAERINAALRKAFWAFPMTSEELE